MKKSLLTAVFFMMMGTSNGGDRTAKVYSGAAGKSAAENGSTDHRLKQEVTVPVSQLEIDYWAGWKSRFIRNLAGKGPVSSIGTAGC